MNLTGKDNEKVVKSFTSSPVVFCRGSPWTTLSNTLLRDSPDVTRNVDDINGKWHHFLW